MELKRVVKPLVVGGVVAATMFSPIQPLRKMELIQAVAYAANIYSEDVRPFTERKHDYVEGKTFKDVPAGKWYSKAVANAYKLGLITGKPNQMYDPNGDVTIAEVLVMAAKLHSYGVQGEYTQWTGTNPWYWHGVEWCENHGIIKPGEFEGRYNNKARRDEVAHILANVFDERQYQILNKKPSNSDITARNTKYVDDINTLYQAGILSGKDNLGNFYPAHNITRAEMASIILRVALPEQRNNTGYADDIDRQLEERNKNNPSVIITPVKPGTQPTEPSRPQTPDKPSEPEVHEKPQSPTEPSRPETPNRPQEQEEPNKPEINETPDRPIEPSKPEIPETPNKPTEPERIEPGSTNPNPSDYADWFFDVYCEDSSVRRGSSFDPLPQNWEECSEEIINRLREKEGSQPIRFNATLAKVSQIRAEELHTSFSHKRPNGESIGSLYREVGYRQPGEDLGGSAEAAHKSSGRVSLPFTIYSWMNSPAHYELIVEQGNPRVAYGLAYYTSGGITYWSFNTGDY